MACLSLGLHNGEPPSSSDQGKNETPRERETNSSAHETSVQLSIESARGNGHAVLKSTRELDEFDADRFEDDLTPSEDDTREKPWISATAGQVRRPIATGGNDAMSSGPERNAQRGQPQSHLNAPSLP